MTEIIPTATPRLRPPIQHRPIPLDRETYVAARMGCLLGGTQVAVPSGLDARPDDELHFASPDGGWFVAKVRPGMRAAWKGEAEDTEDTKDVGCKVVWVGGIVAMHEPVRREEVGADRGVVPLDVTPSPPSPSSLRLGGNEGLGDGGWIVVTGGDDPIQGVPVIHAPHLTPKVGETWAHRDGEPENDVDVTFIGTSTKRGVTKYVVSPKSGSEARFHWTMDRHELRPIPGVMPNCPAEPESSAQPPPPPSVTYDPREPEVVADGWDAESMRAEISRLRSELIAANIRADQAESEASKQASLFAEMKDDRDRIAASIAPDGEFVQLRKAVMECLWWGSDDDERWPNGMNYIEAIKRLVNRLEVEVCRLTNELASAHDDHAELATRLDAVDDERMRLRAIVGRLAGLAELEGVTPKIPSRLRGMLGWSERRQGISVIKYTELDTRSVVRNLESGWDIRALGMQMGYEVGVLDACVEYEVLRSSAFDTLRQAREMAIREMEDLEVDEPDVGGEMGEALADHGNSAQLTSSSVAPVIPADAACEVGDDNLM